MARFLNNQAINRNVNKLILLYDKYRILRLKTNKQRG